ncbi:MAG: response regulator [Lachnospiraceae bacterium]|nr:response regulator [Lachnospiraceae bacterium]
MNRLKLIIVDDEMLIRKLIRMKLEEIKLDIDIIGEYGDSKSAMEAVKELKPDIILSDICMPGEDGISFSEACLNIYPDTRIIIITGFNDFEYARRSIKAGVSDYIMKPVQNDELKDAICHVMDEITDKKKQDEEKKILRAELEESIPVLQSYYLNNLISSDEPDEENYLKLRELGIDTDNESSEIRLGLLAMRESAQNPELPMQAEREVRNFFISEDRIYTVRDNWGRIIIISDNRGFPIEQCISMLSELIKEKYGCHIMSGCSDRYGDFREVRKAYLEVLQNLMKHHAQKRKDRDETEDSMMSSDLMTVIKNIRKSLDEGNAEKARYLAVSIAEETKEAISEHILPGRIRVFIKELCRELNVDINTLRRYADIRNYQSREELKWWLNDVLTDLMVNRESNDSQIGILKKAVEYINDNIADPNLNQNDLSGRFNLSSSHFGRLMKQHIGRTYSEVISDIRLCIMTDLIHNSDLKDRDIGLRIGIDDPHYLSIWFKKVTGYTVSEYRKKF